MEVAVVIRPPWISVNGTNHVVPTAHIFHSISLLAFFSRGDIKDQPKLQKQVISRLKKVAPQAEKAGVILGLARRERPPAAVASLAR